MKRKLITVLILLFASFTMVGCDLFGGGDDTTTTEPPTQTSTTEEPATTTQPPTTAVGDHTVIFYDGDGSVFSTQTVSDGGSATNPGTPTKAATAQYTYTFDTWAQDYSNVLADMNIYPVFTETLNTYTVTFYDGDGTIIDTQTISYGSGATSPTQTPVKAPEGADLFEFNDWDTDFSNITGDTSVNPLFNTLFNRAALLEMVQMMFGSSYEDPEDTLIEVMTVFEITSEETMYYKLVDIWDLYEQLFSVRSGTELQTWYAATKTAGFDKTFYTTTLFNAMTMGFTNDYNYYLNREIEVLADIANFNAGLVNANASILALQTEADNYCSLGVDPALSADCHDYWSDLNTAHELKMQYDYELDEAYRTEEYVYWGYYYNLISIQDQLIYHTVVTLDPTEIDYYQNEYDDLMSELPSELIDIYNPLLSSYSAYKTMEYDLYSSDNYAHLEVTDLTGDIILEQLRMLFDGDGGYPDTDYHYWGLRYYLDSANYYSNELLYLAEDLEEVQERLLNATVQYNLVMDPTYEQNIKDLFGTAYDMLDAVALTIDDELSDMMYDLGIDILFQTLSFNQSYYYIDDYEQVNYASFDSGMEMYFALEYVTAENIEFLASRLNTTILAAYGTLDQTDYDNIKVLLLAYLEEQMQLEGSLNQTEIDAALVEYGLLYDKYVGYFQTAVTEVTDLLGSIGPVKAAALEALVNENYGVMTDIDIAVLVSQIIEILNGDGVFDLATIMQNVVDIYCDVNDSFNPTPTELADIQTDMGTFVTDTLTLITTISAYDSHLLTVAEVENVMELISRVWIMDHMFDNAFEYIGDPVEPFEMYYYDQFVDEFMNGLIEPDQAIALYKNIFGTTDAESTYYVLRSVQQYLLGVSTIRSFEDLHIWMGNLESFGYTQAEIVSFIMDYVTWYSNEFVGGTPEFLEEVSWLENDLNYYISVYDNLVAEIASLDDNVQLAIDDFDSMYQTTAADYWQALKEGVELQREQYRLEHEIRWNMDDGAFDSLLCILDDIIYSTEISDPAALASAEADYATFLADYSEDPYLTALIGEFRIIYINNYNYYDDVIDPLLDILDDADPAAFENFIWITDNNIIEYDWKLSNLESLQYEIDYYQERIDELYEQLDFIIYVYDIFNDPTNYLATETAINLVLDDLQNMVSTMPAESFELIEQIVEFVSMMDYYYHYEINSVNDLPFTASDLYDFSQDLSAFLKLRANTLDASELAVLENYILILITEYVEDMELAEPEHSAEIARINALVLKYIGFADDALDELTALLDGLTEADIQLLFDTIDIMNNDGSNIYYQVVMVAKTIDAIYDPVAVDLDVLVDIFLELYFDIEYGNYDPQDLLDTQAAWNLYITDIEALIATIATYDENNLNPLNYPTLVEVQQAVMYLGVMFEDPMDILINPPTTYVYDSVLLDNIIAEMFDIDPTNTSEITSFADTLITILDITPGDYEALYYEMLGIGSIFMNVGRIETPQDVFTIYQSIRLLGYTNADLANIATEVIMTFLYPQLGDMSDTSGLETEILDLQALIDDFTTIDIVNIDVEIQNEISIISCDDPLDVPDAQLALQDIWLSMKDEVAQYAAYDQIIEDVYRFDFYFDWELWYQIQEAIDNDDYSYAESLLEYVDHYENNYLYFDLYNEYRSYHEQHTLTNNLIENLYNDYGYISVSYDTGKAIVDYMYEKSQDILYIYYAIRGLEYEIMELQYEIEDIEIMAPLFLTIQGFLDVGTNVTMTEDVLVVLLDQFEAWSNDPNFDIVYEIDMILNKGPAGLTMLDISNKIQTVGAIFTNLLGTIDATDEQLLIDFMINISSAYCDAAYDSTQAAVMKVYFEDRLEEILPEIFDMPPVIGTFLNSFDETKTEAVFNQVIEMFLSCPADPNSEVRQVIVIAGLIDLVVGDSSLAYEDLISPIYKIIYEVETLTGNPPVDPVQDYIDDLVDQLDALILTAGTVSAFDPVDISEAQWLVIDELIDMIEGLQLVFAFVF